MSPMMHPPPGERLLRHVGDALEVSLEHPSPGAGGWRAFLRTNLTRAARQGEELIALATAAGTERTFAGAAWRDLPMRPVKSGWELSLPLLEVGAFQAKAFAIDPEGCAHWPEGDDLGLSVHPDHLRTANAVYCAFPRLLPSGTLRSLTRLLPHVFEDLGCRILHLLPVGPVPVSFARMGRLGSPYAQLDLSQIDPALVEFDPRATAEDQFRELAAGVHRHGGLLLLDVVVNHTGWGSRLMSDHPEWFLKDARGAIRSPGAWGIIWADLAELDPAFPGLWAVIADSLLVWCRRGVDGFRCDAGYMVPLPVWEYVMARVRREFPDTVFLLEGLGGAWEATSERMAAGMQWAYSELFQNFNPLDVSGYLDHVLAQGPRLGPLLHYSETHDNPRLARRGASWSLTRNRLSALSSQSGAWGFTSGVEWLATEKIDVHDATDLRWGREPNLVHELGALNALLKDHPCFFDAATVTRISPPESWVLALLRASADGLDHGLVLVNLDAEHFQELTLDAEAVAQCGEIKVELLDQLLPDLQPLKDGSLRISLSPGWAGVLASQGHPAGLGGDAYRRLRAQAAWALRCVGWVIPAERMGAFDWRELGALAARDPAGFLGGLRHLEAGLDPLDPLDLLPALRAAVIHGAGAYPALVRWSAEDAQRVTLVPPGHPVLIEAAEPFSLHVEGLEDHPIHLRAVPVDRGFVAALPPRAPGVAASVGMRMLRHREGMPDLDASLRYLSEVPALDLHQKEGGAILVNGRGSYARFHPELSRITSKYDAVLAANLDPVLPVERHVLVKRLRAWCNADGFLTALDASNLRHFEPGPPVRWIWDAHAGDARRVHLELQAWMPTGANTVCFRFSRGPGIPEAEVRLTARLDLEDRGHHGETDGDADADVRFRQHTQPLGDRPGFAFAPAPEISLRAWSSTGAFHPDPEWCRHIHHPLEATRAQRDHGDAWSPGWFELPLKEGESVDLALGVEADFSEPPGAVAPPDLDGALRAALPAFLVRRGDGLTLLAGYPWFLDWGRDAFIGCRGLIAAGLDAEALSVLRAFGALEKAGTLPNALFGNDDANRDSSDAPLWFALACEEAVARLGSGILDAPCGARNLREVLDSIAQNYLKGTATGVKVDASSGLAWSPAHFTWMDTSHPAGSPREGYPIELQALWIRLLRFLQREGGSGFDALADRAKASLDLFWREESGFASDTLHAPAGRPATDAIPDDHLRPNQLWLVALGLWGGNRARRMVDACGRHLLVPGALRSLAPLKVDVPLPVKDAAGHLLNDPHRPYWGRYEGDEDTRRKPAYHNGSAWVWLLPLYAEALAAAWPEDAAARRAARAILGSLAPLLETGCLGQLPELLDGDAPHASRGCDAQAWSITEALRVWRTLTPFRA